MQFIYYPLFALVYTISLLPFKVMYALSDFLLYPLVYHVVRYRRALVRRQLAECFPERSEAERHDIEHRFYHYFCDYIVETIKMMSISSDEMRRRMEIVGLSEAEDTTEACGKMFAFGYLGHYCNWEWLSSFSLYLTRFTAGQIYHPLRNRAFDQLFLHMRERQGAKCIAMKETLRHILHARRDGRKIFIGFIADQSPKWEAMHQWCDFLHHETSFFIGTEKIGKQVDAVIYYIDLSRPRRGYYRAELKLITTEPKSTPDYELTDRYAQLLEQSIQREPHLWLWTHNRWKRTRQEWLRRQAEATK